MLWLVDAGIAYDEAMPAIRGKRGGIAPHNDFCASEENLEPSLDTLWNRALSSGQGFGPGQLDGRPDNVRRYLKHAIAPGTPLASAVRLQMHGEIKLKGWCPFTAEQVICRDGDMMWRATVRMHGMPIYGFDRLVGGIGRMQWKMFGLLPVVSATGADITRSVAGRVCAESVWLPSALCGDNISWSAPDAARAHASRRIADEATNLTVMIDENGRLEQLLVERWGNPEGEAFHYAGFGAFIDDETTFDGYTIPSRLRAGWHPNGKYFDADGEFFRVIVDHAQFR
jgi:hypothetical protein